MEKDLVDYAYLSDEERYADLFNGTLFGGKQVLEPERLREADTRSRTADKKRPRNRDILKKYGDDASYMVLGVENQEEISYCMPFRMLEYETAEYSRQVRRIKRKNKNAKGLSEGEFLEKYRKEDRINPCVSLVLYWGSSWDGSETLQEMMNPKALPEQWRSFVNDYRMYLVKVRELADTGVFKTDIKQVVDFLQCCENKEKLQELLMDNPDYMNLDEETYDVMMVHAHSKELEALRDKVKEDGGNMCKALADWAEEERGIGREEGHEAGIREGIESGLKALVDSVKQFCGDFDALYATVVANECYKDVTREHVMKYV